ncbi:SH3-domain-containing protein [Daedalea quercina L-15889]|uniref:SH3-domain-containing protein n=1 Tax=Daedalea quercina L-15889 TaxID=1314783 RepID=A0A165PY56_9APHY|nr:SH3-domain-containing protein [Daedalea quercina L-15889]
MADQAYLAHILSQTRANIDFLAAHNHISRADADLLRARLPSANAASALPVEEINNLSVSAPGRRVVPPPPPRSAPTQRARALWAYNEDGSEPNDLSFSSGEIVEVIDETNADWWTGRCRGRQGLFPSNHVEKIDGSAPAHVPPPMPVYAPPPQQYGPPQPYAAGPPPSEKPAYRPFGATYAGYDQPPPVQAPAPVNSMGLQQDPGQEKKKSKFGRLGDTMATSAAGGVGFGAGAAIGSGIVGAIF